MSVAATEGSAAATAAAGPEFSVERNDGPDGLVVTLRGELDLSGVPVVEEATREVPAGGRLVIEARELSFMDSSGLRTLMNLDLRARAEGWTLTLAHPQPQVLRVVTLCGLEQRITVQS